MTLSPLPCSLQVFPEDEGHWAPQAPAVKKALEMEAEMGEQEMVAAPAAELTPTSAAAPATTAAVAAAVPSAPAVPAAAVPAAPEEAVVTVEAVRAIEKAPSVRAAAPEEISHVASGPRAPPPVVVPIGATESVRKQGSSSPGFLARLLGALCYRPSKASE